MRSKKVYRMFTRVVENGFQSYNPPLMVSS
ncbi:hypothetical protein Pla52o_43980 [Novipirellula galeiformis]|uniref:Uncharacterized protein n=1 Tax=Novipirellula galeiformis TaxID=2528004 RepID=A0A5C6C7A3_9BACT|nr:hypothetical protein Pla52o_43980 [Novipirellula galeiformis]